MMRRTEREIKSERGAKEEVREEGRKGGREEVGTEIILKGLREEDEGGLSITQAVWASKRTKKLDSEKQKYTNKPSGRGIKKRIELNLLYEN